MPNLAGGINGRKVEFVNINTESDSTKSVTAAKRLIEREKAVAIIGTTSSGSVFESLAPAPAANA